MKFEEIYEKTKYAFENDEVYELLTGEKGYAYQAPMFPFSVPTCDEYIFRDGIFPYFRAASQTDKDKILLKLNNSLRKMIFSENEAMVWWALCVLQGQKDYESHFKTSPFFIADTFWDELRSVLASKKTKLQLNKSFLGANHVNGLWGEVKRINRFLFEDYGITVLNGDVNE